MMRFVILILQIAVLAAVAVWLSDRPGSARIVWHDTVIETSAAFLGLCVLLFAYALHLLWRLWHFLRHGPAHWRLRRKIGKLQKGQEQLTQGLIAIASGNASEAGRLAVAARKNADQSVAATWLQAQAAQLAGDTHAARALFRMLAANPDAAVLGYRGLITEAKRAGKWDEVDGLVSELQRIKPATPWLSLIRMESAARRGQWGDAESALSHAVTAHLMDSVSGRRHRAALRIAAARQALASGDNDAALRAAEQAAQQTPDWLPGSINLADVLAATGHNRAARRVIERSWKNTPHPQLAEILAGLSDDPLDAYKQIEHMCRGHENTADSQMALAAAALDADIWGEARRYLTAIVNDGKATQGVYKLLARLERLERGDEGAAGAWLAKLSEAPPDPMWLCDACGGAHKIWHPTCAHCGAFNTLDWRRAGQSRRPTPMIGNEHD